MVTEDDEQGDNLSMSEPATSASPANLHSLVLVLSSARSGSALLCEDIVGLGGLGNPQEYLRGIRSRSRAKASADDVLGRLAAGVQEDAPGVTALHLMVPQVAVTAQVLHGKRVPAIEALPGVIDWAKERFDRLLLVFVVRNAIDQAISHVVADAKDAAASAADAETGARPAAAIPNVNQLILGNLGRVVRDRNILLEAYSRYADSALLVTYDELHGAPAETATRLVAQAREAGFEVRNDQVVRGAENGSGAERFTELREGFLDYLKNETGVDPDDPAASAGQPDRRDQEQ